MLFNKTYFLISNSPYVTLALSTLTASNIQITEKDLMTGFLFVTDIMVQGKRWLQFVRCNSEDTELMFMLVAKDRETNT